jgi:hypothetical protein
VGDGRFSLQVGKFAAVIGNWMERHLSWDNPFINAPLPYENATALEDQLAPTVESYFDGLLHDARIEYIPVIWGPSYASGVSVAGRLGKLEYAAEIKNASLSSRPESWDATRIGFEHPTVSGRLGYRPNPTWNFGFSASDGAYFRPTRDLLCRRHRHWRLSPDVSRAGYQLRLASSADLGGGAGDAF